jgi:hypothetical protein
VIHNVVTMVIKYPKGFGLNSSVSLNLDLKTIEVWVRFGF